MGSRQARRGLRSLVFVLALLCAFIGCRKTEHAARRPNILLIVVDTLRADRLGSYGNTRGLTPFLDRLAANATVFRDTYATSSWTMSSMASLFTSRYPYQHGVGSVLTKLDSRELSLAEVLAHAGYRTAAFVTNPLLTPVSGYDQGFDFFQVAPEAKPRADHVREQSLAWIDSTHEEAPPAPIFLYLHFMEPHWPYSPPPIYRDRFLEAHEDADAGMLAMKQKLRLQYSSQFSTRKKRSPRQDFTPTEARLLQALYDAEVAALDAELEILFAELEQRDFLKDAIVVFTSDHGEELLDHGNLWHTYTLYDESIRVPLIIRVPGQEEGLVIDNAVSLIDVAPSIANLLRIEVPHEFNGHSFADLLREQSWFRKSFDAMWNAKPATRQLLAELQMDAIGGKQKRLHSAAIVEEDIKVLTRPNGDTEMYDLASDPGETTSQDRSDADIVPRLLADLRKVRAEGEQNEPTGKNVELDDATRERLKILGYLVDEEEK